MSGKFIVNLVKAFYMTVVIIRYQEKASVRTISQMLSRRNPFPLCQTSYYYFALLWITSFQSLPWEVRVLGVFGLVTIHTDRHKCVKPSLREISVSLCVVTYQIVS